LKGAVALLALALPAAALAQDALLDVPVRVANVPAAASVGSVTCAVFSDPSGPSSGVGYLGSGSKWFALSNGAFAGKIAVPVKFDAGSGPARAYRCALYFIFKEDGRTLTLAAGGLADPRAVEHRVAFKPAPGGAPVYEVTGRF
jgi:hypothetical protein